MSQEIITSFISEKDNMLPAAEDPATLIATI